LALHDVGLRSESLASWLAIRGKAAGMVLWPPSAIVTRISWDQNHFRKQQNCVNSWC
jgi:hypothetical protein